jgi:Ca2+-binding EF-hand superfamily protein
MSLLEMMAMPDPEAVTESLVELFNVQNSKSHGHLLMRPQFLPAGQLKIHVVDGKGLRALDQAGRQDPYVVFTVDGQAATIKKKTKVITDGGTDPVWDEVVVLDIVDQYDLQVEVFDHDLLGDDDLIGKCSISLLPVFKKGEVDTWVGVKSQSDYGAPSTAAGEVHLVFEFEGPSGVRYPQNQPGVDSYDEKERVAYLNAQEAVRRPRDNQIVDNRGDGDSSSGGGGQSKRKRDTTFSDEEIEAAFRFIDLDKNGYIGANELRHVLICMGEMITDEEVDMMINMVDSDGDGQVSYTEFYELITDPDPGSPEFRKAGVAAPKVEMKRNADDAKFRAKELASREEKRAMLATFVEDNSVGGAEMKYVVDQAQMLPLAERQAGIDFPTFCRLNQVDPTGEYHKLFTLYDLEEQGVIDYKAITLGMLNFVEMDKETRCDFVFRIFDEDSSGLLEMKELMDILSANHMQSLDAVKRKAETIMKTADRDGNGELSMEEFRIVAQKFPNILFPSFSKNPGGAGEE